MTPATIMAGLLMIDSGPVSIKEENSINTENESKEVDAVDKIHATNVGELNHSPHKTTEATYSPCRAIDKKHLAYEDILSELKQRIEKLLVKDDFTLNSTRVDLKFLQKQTRYIYDPLILYFKLFEAITVLFTV